MSNQGSNNNSGGFLQRFQGWISIGTGLFGFLTALVGFIKLALGDTGLITNILLVVGIVSLWLLCAYVYWKPYSVSRSAGFGVTPLSPSKQYKRLRRLALAGMFVTPILTIASFYTWQHLPTKDIIVLLADFQASSEEKQYGVTQNIFEQMEEATQKYSDVKIQLLNKVVTEKKEALNEGKKYKATIVIWGQYRVTSTTVQLNPHFEVLRPPKYLPKIGRLEQTAAVAELNSFKLQTHLSSEMVYLSLFTVGLTRYTISDWDRAITSFSDALGQVKDPIKELDKSIVYIYRGSAYVQLKDYDRAIADYNQAIKLDPNFTDAYNNRGLAYDDKKDYDRAIADYNQALKLDPSLAIAYYNRGLAYKNQGNKDKAVGDFKKFLELSNDVEWNQKAKQNLQELGTF